MANMKYFVTLLFLLVGFGLSRIPSEMFYEVGSIIAVIMIAAPVFYGMYRAYGSRGMWVMVALGIFSLVIETIGLYTGFPYSHFEYLAPFGYRLFGSTPWTVAIAWSPIVTGAYALSHRWFIKWWSRLSVYVGLLVSIDVVLDPGAVARGLWQYTEGGLWYNVPLHNFAGWVFSGIIAYGIITWITHRQTLKFNKWLVLPTLASLALWTGATFGYSMIPVGIIGVILIMIILFGLNKKSTH